jgi:putative transposase
MAYKKYNEEQILAVLKEAQAGMKTSDICRKHGISDVTLYNWKAKYSGLSVSELRRFKGIEAENSRLKQIVADQTLDIQALKAALSKNF